MIPSNVQDIMSKLNTVGFQAYIVGGSVRDIVLGKEPSDFDIATDARPEQVLVLFENTKSTENSRAHGTVFVGGIDVTTLVREHMYNITTPKSVRRLLVRLNNVPVEDLFALRHADIFGHDGIERLEDLGLRAARQIVVEIRARRDALKVTDLAIDGNDLIAMGYVPGPLFGQVLSRLLNEVLDNEKLNDTMYLTRRARELAHELQNIGGTR